MHVGEMAFGIHDLQQLPHCRKVCCTVLNVAMYSLTPSCFHFPLSLNISYFKVESLAPATPTCNQESLSQSPPLTPPTRKVIKQIKSNPQQK